MMMSWVLWARFRLLRCLSLFFCFFPSKGRLGHGDISRDLTDTSLLFSSLVPVAKGKLVLFYFYEA